MSLGFSVDYISYQEPSGWNFSLMNSAYGCSPQVAGTLGSKEEAFENIQIFTINDFDDDHLAGSSLNDLLVISNFNIDPTLLNDFLSNLDDNVQT